MIPFILIIITSSIAVIAGYVDFQSKLKDQKEQTEKERKRSEESENLLKKSNDILSKTTDIITSQHTVIDTSKKIIELQNELNRKNLELQSLQNSTLEKITGGKSVPQLQFIVAAGVSIYIKVANDTNLPIRNVVVKLTRVVNDFFDKVTPDGNKTTDNPDAVKDWTYDMGDLSVKSEKFIADERFPMTLDSYHYTFEVRWLNGSYHGGFSITDGKGKWKVADGSIGQHTEGFDCSKAAQINYTPLKVDNNAVHN